MRRLAMISESKFFSFFLKRNPLLKELGKGKLAFLLLFISILFIIVINRLVIIKSSKDIHKSLQGIKPAYTAILPGAGVYSNKRVSAIVYDRIIKTVELYKKRKVLRILVTGDHGTRYYDEVNTIKYRLEKLGIPERIIFTDHAGFSTYDSIYRAAAIFQVKSAIIVTQDYHLPRAVYLAGKHNIKAQGYPADRRKYLHILRYRLREYLARIKDFLLINTIKPAPRFLGDKIPITGSNKDSDG
jgi:SanA protein